MTSRSEVLAALKGQRVRIPDLQALFQEWPQQTSPHVARLQKDVDVKLEELMPQGKRLQQMKKGNIAHFTGTWWPFAGYEQSKNIAYLSIWLFNWDDETDSMEFSNMADHFDAEQRFRQDTLAFIRQCLSPVPLEGSTIEESDNRVSDKENSEAEGSISSTSGSAAADDSSSSSADSVAKSTENPSPRPSTTIPQITKRNSKEAASFTKFVSASMGHIRDSSTVPQAAGDAIGTVPGLKAELRVGPQPKGQGSSVKSRRMTIKGLANSIAKHFRTRADSAVHMSGGGESSPAEAANKEMVAAVVAPRSPLILSFKTIAERICPDLSPHEHRRFLLECEKFIAATEQEQKLRVRGVLPDVEEYIAMRMDTGGVAICLAMHEYVLQIQLPNAIREDPDMAQIWLQTSMIICIVNDMLSIKKEIAQDETDSLLPILVGSGKTPQMAMDHAFGMVQSAKWALDAAAQRLSEKVRSSYNEQVRCDLEKFVDSCRMACTGSTIWSIESGRYKIGVPSLKGGVMIFLE